MPVCVAGLAGGAIGSGGGAPSGVGDRRIRQIGGSVSHLPASYFPSTHVLG